MRTKKIIKSSFGNPILGRSQIARKLSEKEVEGSRSDSDQEIEKAIKFLVSSIEESGNNSKPVITHCFRVAFYLDYLGYSKDIVVAALLHDLLEDTGIEYPDIKERFGDRIASLVGVLTFDKTIEDKTEGYRSNFDNIAKSGKEALIIRSADILDNAGYYHLVEDVEEHKWLLDKLDYFLNVAEKGIGGEKVYKELVEKRPLLG